MSGEEMRRRMQRVRRDVSLYLLPVMCPMVMLSGVLVSSVAMPWMNTAMKSEHKEAPVLTIELSI